MSITQRNENLKVKLIYTPFLMAYACIIIIVKFYSTCTICQVYACTIMSNPHSVTWILVLIHLTNEGFEVQRLTFSPKELKLLIVLRLNFRLSSDLSIYYTILLLD